MVDMFNNQVCPLRLWSEAFSNPGRAAVRAGVCPTWSSLRRAAVGCAVGWQQHAGCRQCSHAPRSTFHTDCCRHHGRRHGVSALAQQVRENIEQQRLWNAVKPAYPDELIAVSKGTQTVKVGTNKFLNWRCQLQCCDAVGWAAGRASGL